MTNNLPPGWATTTLGAIGNYVNGRAFKPSEWRSSGRPIIRIQNLTGSNNHYNYFDGEADERHIVYHGDLLVSWAATLGVFIWRGKEAVLNQHIFRVESGVNREFHRWMLVNTLTDLFRQTHGSGMVHITKGKFESTPVSLPPLAEQERVVAAIEDYFSRLDAVEEGIRAAEMKISALTSTATPQLFLKNWPTQQIAELAHVGSGATPKRSEVRYWSRGTVPWVTSGAVNERSIVSASELITEDALAETSVKLWPAGTVLVAMYGEGKTRGKAAVLQIRSTCNQACAAIDYDRELISGDYLLAYLNSQYEANRKLASGGVQPNLSLGLIKSMEIPVPSLEIQRSVALQVEEIMLGSDRLSELATTARRYVTALRRSILAAAFLGRLTPQDPDDEPASVLLERIAASRAITPKRRKVSA